MQSVNYAECNLLATIATSPAPHLRAQEFGLAADNGGAAILEQQLQLSCA